MSAVERLSWSVDTPSLLKEMVEGNPGGHVLATPVMIFKNLLAEVAQRAIELDDPQLHILMLRLNLYDVSPADRLMAIDSMKARIT